MILRPAALLLLSALVLATPAATQAAEADDPTQQTEKDWVDDRWTKTEIGQFLHATIETPRRKTAKGIAIRIGDNSEATVCFDTDLLRYSAGWTGGFVRISGQRYGLMGAVAPDGKTHFTTAPQPGWARDNSFKDPREIKHGALPRDWAKYKGFYRSGNRLVLSYSVGQGTVLDSPWFVTAGNLKIFTRTLERQSTDEQLMNIVDVPGGTSASITRSDNIQVAKLNTSEGTFAVAISSDQSGAQLSVSREAINLRLPAHNGIAHTKIFICKLSEAELPNFIGFVKAQKTESLQELTRGGPTRWGEPLMTKGVVDKSNSAFAVDTITMPYENPWNALLFASGHDFFSNGDAAVAAIHGDVWLVRGIDDKLDKITWQRFATGLYQPLGVKIINDKLHVMERDQITILHDLNKDGEADFYENFNNDTIGAGGGHSYTTSLETDSDGNFYFAKCSENTPHGGTVLKIPKNGIGVEVIATGFRNPNGLGMGPRNELTVADQQGDWVPETRLDLIKPGGFYGFTPMHKRATAPTNFDPPLVWVPRAIDNSAGGQVWVPEGTWGNLSGQMLHLSYGRCTMMLVLRDSNSPSQGAVVPLPGRFASGVCRGRFNTKDGHLYLTGLRGWQTAAVRDGCFQRVRYQKELPLPTAYTAGSDTVTITFSEPLSREVAEDLESYSAEMWNYRWSSEYGSPDFTVTNPTKKGRDSVQITAAKLQPDRKTVVLKVPALKPANTFALRYDLESEKGESVQNSIYATINESPPKK
ncbi:MAG TPA: DUF6797 domain-containing protein [Verrucomicrobiae bacterium]